MSKSYHVTLSELKSLTKKEIDEMETDKDSILNQLSQKSSVKKMIKKKRKENNP